uniref:Fatty acyl-CoA reductase n=1 Tax=Ailuropoda melanoleuca TaxID=9646 RepID=A0A7N5K2K7_AILME
MRALLKGLGGEKIQVKQQLRLTYKEPLSEAIKDKRKTMSMIASFYNGKSILITGATGFMGKVLMEKLFRTSPDLKVIYILVRPKAGQTTQQRVFQILNSKECSHPMKAVSRHRHPVSPLTTSICRHQDEIWVPMIIRRSRKASRVSHGLTRQ